VFLTEIAHTNNEKRYAKSRPQESTTAQTKRPHCVGLQSDVVRVDLFRLTEIFQLRFDGIVIYFFNSDFKFFDNASEFSVTSLYIVFIFSSKFRLFFLQSVFYRD